MHLPIATAVSAVLLTSLAGVSPDRPISKWRVDFEDAQCVATRDFGTAATPITLALKRPPIGGELQLSVFTTRVRPGALRQVDASISINDAEAVRTTLLSYDPPTGIRRVYRLNLTSGGADALEKSSSLRLVAGKDLNQRFADPQIGPALKVLDACISDLRAAWNIGPNGTKISTLRAPASAGDFESLFTSRDLPQAGIGLNYEAPVGFVLLIDETGRIADCTVTETSGGGALDAQSCAVPMRLAKFKPALGADGRPTRDFYSYRVNWRFGMEVLRKPGKGN